MCWLNLSNILVIRRHAPVLVRFVRRSVFGLQTHPPSSSRSHQRFSLLVSPFLFTFGSCHDVTPVVTDLLRRFAFYLSRWG